MTSYNRGIKILQWNAQGVKSKSNDLLNLLSVNNVGIALISETFLEDKHSFNIYNFHIERCDRYPNQTERNIRGGSALLIRNHLGYERINIPGNLSCEVVCIKLYLTQYNFLYIISVYAKPKHKISRTEWHNMFSILDDGPLLVGGDFNSHHWSWDRTFTNHCYEGEELFQYIESNDLQVVTNESPTRVHRPGWRDSIIDLTLVSTQLFIDIEDWRVGSDSCGSDHYPIFFSIGNIEPIIRVCNIQKRNFKKADWELYSREVEQNSRQIAIQSQNDGIESYDQFHKVIQDASEKSIPRIQIRKINTKKSRPCWWDAECNKVVAKRRLSLHKFNHAQNMGNYLLYKKEAAKAKRYFRKRNRVEFRNFTSTLRPGVDSRLIWEKIRKLKNPSSVPKLIPINRNWVESFVNKLCPTIGEEVIMKNNRIKNESLDKIITIEELELALSHNKNTSVG